LTFAHDEPKRLWWDDVEDADVAEAVELERLAGWGWGLLTAP
jgi:hypothetical protein